MKEPLDSANVKRTSKDYSLSSKLQIVKKLNQENCKSQNVARNM